MTPPAYLVERHLVPSSGASRHLLPLRREKEEESTIPRLMAKPEAPNKIIYSMVGVSKFHDKKQVLKDIYLSYFYGAKIGVIGLNGSGKSSLLRILAGVDKE